MNLSGMDIKSILTQIDQRKGLIAEHRNRLRELSHDLNDCIESLNAGIEGLEEGKLNIENAIDSLSEQL